MRKWQKIHDVNREGKCLRDGNEISKDSNEEERDTRLKNLATDIKLIIPII